MVERKGWRNQSNWSQHPQCGTSKMVDPEAKWNHSYYCSGKIEIQCVNQQFESGMGERKRLRNKKNRGDHVKCWETKMVGWETEWN